MHRHQLRNSDLLIPHLCFVTNCSALLLNHLKINIYEECKYCQLLLITSRHGKTLICQHWSAEYKTKFTLLTLVCFALSSGFLMTPRRRRLSSWSLCKSPCGGGLNLLCHFNPLPPAVEQACSNGWSSSQPPNTSLNKKKERGRKVGKLNTVVLDGHPAKSFSPIQMLISLLTVIGRQSSCFKASSFWSLFSTFSVMKGKHCKIPALLNKTCRWPGAKHCHATNKCSITIDPDLE